MRSLSSWISKALANLTLSLQSFCPLWKAECFPFPVFFLDLVALDLTATFLLWASTFLPPRLCSPTWMGGGPGAGTTALPHNPNLIQTLFRNLEWDHHWCQMWEGHGQSWVGKNVFFKFILSNQCWHVEVIDAEVERYEIVSDCQEKWFQMRDPFVSLGISSFIPG